jgi:hypothetical protein
MNANQQPTNNAELYQICIRGHLDTRWAERFEGLNFCHHSNGTTTLSGLVIDQSALYGFLRKVRDLGMPLIWVVQLDRS